jgi:hypothetical protein
MAAKKGVIEAKKTKRGRKTDFKNEYCDQVYKLCLLGAKDTELADFFNVSERTLNTWKKKQPKFLQSMKKGKIQADAKVAERLFKRATGYEYKEVYWEKVDSKEKLEKTPDSQIQKDQYKKKVVTKELAPDSIAGMFWLKNRQPENWRDKQEHELSGKGGNPIEVKETINYEKLSDAALREIINAAGPEKGKN